MHTVLGRVGPRRAALGWPRHRLKLSAMTTVQYLWDRLRFTTSTLSLRISSTMDVRCAHCSKLYVSRLLDLADLNRLGSPSVVSGSNAWYPHHRSLPDLKASAKQGCDFCQFLLHCISSRLKNPRGQISISVESQAGSTGIVENLLVRIRHQTLRDILHLRLLTARGRHRWREKKW
jgi:hypothetical protein